MFLRAIHMPHVNLVFILVCCILFYQTHIPTVLIHIFQNKPSSCRQNTCVNFHVNFLYLHCSLCWSEKPSLEGHVQFLLTDSFLEVCTQEGDRRVIGSWIHNFSRNLQISPLESCSHLPTHTRCAMFCFNSSSPALGIVRLYGFCQSDVKYNLSGVLLGSSLTAGWAELLSPHMIISHSGFPFCWNACTHPLSFSFCCRFHHFGWLAQFPCTCRLLTPWSLRCCKYLLDSHQTKVTN